MSGLGSLFLLLAETASCAFHHSCLIIGFAAVLIVLESLLVLTVNTRISQPACPWQAHHRLIAGVIDIRVFTHRCRRLGSSPVSMLVRPHVVEGSVL